MRRIMGMGRMLAVQAREMGAEALVYYTLSRNSDMGHALHMQAAEQACGELGLEFIPVEVPDDTHDSPAPGLGEFFRKDTLLRAEGHGAIAFYGANCSMQEYLLPLVAEHGWIYPQPCCMLYQHGIWGLYGGEQGSIAGYRVSREELEVNTLYRCAIRHINGETIDMQALAAIMEEYAGAECTLRLFEDGAAQYENYILYTVTPTPMG